MWNFQRACDEELEYCKKGKCDPSLGEVSPFYNLIANQLCSGNEDTFFDIICKNMECSEQSLDVVLKCAGLKLSSKVVFWDRFNSTQEATLLLQETQEYFSTFSFPYFFTPETS